MVKNKSCKNGKNQWILILKGFNWFSFCDITVSHMLVTQVYIGVTDHLWEKHCQKDFRNAQLEEYESWREMYLRMYEERERKLKQLTKSIVSAHSGKPKGSLSVFQYDVL